MGRKQRYGGNRKRESERGKTRDADRERGAK